MFTSCWFTVALLVTSHRFSCSHSQSIKNPTDRFLPPYGDFLLNVNQSKNDINSAQPPSWVVETTKSPKSIAAEKLPKLNTTYSHQTEWPASHKKLGTVSAVSFDLNTNAVIFHRVDRIWSGSTFNTANEFLDRSLGPITDSTLIALDRRAGKVVYECGKNMFYMPHGLTIDHENNIWVTDVALHQVLKLAPKCSSDKPQLTLGVAFVPGAGKKFCKPTAVAVLRDGNFFVADGYCNSRILKFSKSGEIILSWGVNTFQGEPHEIAPPNFFAVPHGLTLTKNDESLCVADRENGRVQCFYASNCTFQSQYHSGVIGDRLFGVAYAPVADGRLFVVNGPEYKRNHEIQGYIIDMKNNAVLSKFGPNGSQFSNPHDIAVLPDASEIYVAELDPPRIHKFVAMELFNVVDAIKNSTNVTFVEPKASIVMSDEAMIGPTVLIVSLAVLAACLMLVAFLIISKQRRRGNLEVAVSSDVEYRKLMSKESL